MALTNPKPVDRTGAPLHDSGSPIPLTRSDIQLLLEPWYHDFSPLGLRTPQRAGIYRPNQAAKQAILFGLIDRALSICRDKGLSLEGVELFCADCFYANYAAQRGAQIVGVDRDLSDLSKAALITRVLENHHRIRLCQQDVFDLEGQYTFGICAGGLYHLSNPQELLRFLRDRITTALVVQTVYSLEKTSADYFESPAPGWTWGCRFSHSYLLKMVAEAGWHILASSTNELGGNEKLQDRGSAYLLCVPEDDCSTPRTSDLSAQISRAAVDRPQELRISLPTDPSS